MSDLDLDLDLKPEPNNINNISNLNIRQPKSLADTNARQQRVKSKVKQTTENYHDVIPSNVISIIEAKHEWESIVDGINQLAIILLDKKLNIIRINKTIEKWGWGKVKTTIGLHVSEFIEPIISPHKHDEFYHVWVNLDNNKTTEWESKYNSSGKIYRFSFYPIKDTGKYSDRKKQMCHGSGSRGYHREKTSCC